jgi:hypothetical protein
VYRANQVLLVGVEAETNPRKKRVKDVLLTFDAFDPSEARDPHGQWTTGGDPSGQSANFPEAAKLEKLADEEVSGEVWADVVGPDEFGAGFLTPRGTLLDIGGHTHERVAEAAGTSLDELLNEGAARVYGGDFLGIEITRRPTREQMRSILAIRAAQRRPNL